jgi:hypothetical protein
VCDAEKTRRRSAGENRQRATARAGRRTSAKVDAQQPVSFDSHRSRRLNLTTAISIGEDDLPFPHSQIKSRQRVRDLAEVYTHKREVESMLGLVADMFPSEEQPLNIDRTFLEPACGSGNFIEEILRRKLAFVTTERVGRGERYEHRLLRCLSSIYGIDISSDNVLETQDRMRALLNSHLDNDPNTQAVSQAFVTAVEVILATNIIQADTLADAATIELVEYRPVPGCSVVREWSFLEPARNEENLFSALTQRKDAFPVHYSKLIDHPGPYQGVGEEA